MTEQKIKEYQLRQQQITQQFEQLKTEYHQLSGAIAALSEVVTNTDKNDIPGSEPSSVEG